MLTGRNIFAVCVSESPVAPRPLSLSHFKDAFLGVVVVCGGHGLFLLFLWLCLMKEV